ncbi:MAG: sporulation protein YqfD [Clostridia bacterium]|nr:sporulation protein YqfD [Clostridia bacterium]
MRADLFFFGFVNFEVPIEKATALFEHWRAIGFSPKGVKRDEKNGKIRFTCTLRGAKRMSGGAFAPVETGRGGLPVLLSGLVRRPGLLCGLLLALALIIGARLFVWEVDVEGNESIPREELLTELSAVGLSRGTFLPRLDGDGVAIALRQGDSRVAFATVNLKGTVAHVQIREAAQAPDGPVTVPANLVAKCDGVVVLPLIFEGEALVQEGDVVRAGQILAGGLIDTEKHGYRVTRAAGQVLARTVHTYTVTIPLSYEEKVYTGKSGYDVSLLFFGLRGKVFKTTGNINGECDIIQNIKWWTLSNGRTLPVGFVIDESAEYELRTANRTGAEARELAYAELERLLAADSAGRTMLERTVEVRADADGITLYCTVVCEEDIAATVEFDADQVRK